MMMVRNNVLIQANVTAMKNNKKVMINYTNVMKAVI